MCDSGTAADEKTCANSTTYQSVLAQRVVLLNRGSNRSMTHQLQSSVDACSSTSA
jgi:hypothetical protein